MILLKARDRKRYLTEDSIAEFDGRYYLMNVTDRFRYPMDNDNWVYRDNMKGYALPRDYIRKILIIFK